MSEKERCNDCPFFKEQKKKKKKKNIPKEIPIIFVQEM